MAMPYQSQPYMFYNHPHWPEDVKPALTDDETSSILDDKVLDSSTPAEMTSADASDSRRPSIAKLEDDYPGSTHAWHERPHGVMQPTRQYSQSSIPLSHSQGQYFGLNTANCAPGYVPNQPWPLLARSETNTPTPYFGAVQENFGQQAQYTGGPVNFPNYPQQDPASAVSMSPQSSQGGWASTTSSDAAETAPSLRHTRFRPATETLVVRSDGIRKKNAKFEIPKERNLHTIDALIMQSTNEDEKKELKQQKRLLRNRQAALDSRLRKKQNAEKLEQDKKLLSSQKTDLEDAIAALEHALIQEREQSAHQRQQYEQYIQQVQYERDEAIRTKTLETAELRRMNNILKDTVRDLERQTNARAFSAHASDAFSTDFTNLGALDLEDNWDDDFSLLNSEEDMKMEEPDSLQRQVTPRPATSSTHLSAPTSIAKSSDVKVDVAVSWETFYTFFFYGVLSIVSQASSKAASAAPSAAVVVPSMPALSEDYRAEAGNVLQAVLASAPEVAHDILPSRPARSVDNNDFSNAFSESGMSRMTPQTSTPSLDSLHTTLATPSRHQQAAAAFSLSADSYNHIANADGVFDNDDDDDEVVEVKPSRIQQMFANLQAERDSMEKMSGLGSKARERSVLLDRVPENVLRNFRDMIARTA